MSQLLWRIGRIWERIYRFVVRTIHAPKRIDFGEGLAAPRDYTGSWEVCWPNGKIKLRCQMTNGVEHGEYICFSKEGSIVQTGQMRNGSCYGEWKDYSIYGWHFKTTEYVDRDNFTTIYYNMDGSVARRDRMEDGVEVESQEFASPEGGGVIVIMPESDADEERPDGKR